MKRSYILATSYSESPSALQFRRLADELVGRGQRCALVYDHNCVDQVSPSSNPAIYTWPSFRPTRVRDAHFLSSLIGCCVPDTVVANFGSVNVMTIVSALRGVPHRIAWYHTVSQASDLDWSGPRWKLRFLRWRKRWVYRLTTMVVANSEYARSDFRSTFLSRHDTAVLHNTIADPLRKFQDMELPSLPLRRQDNRILCVGRFTANKGQDLLIAAARRLLDHAFILEFVGEGPNRKPCEALARDLGFGERCVFRGSLPNAEVLSLMASSICTVVPSQFEAFGLVNIESLSVGTPVVGSRRGGIPEIIDDGKNGLLVDPSNEAEMASKLHTMLFDDQRWMQMHTEARVKFLAKFDDRIVIPSQADFLENLKIEA